MSIVQNLPLIAKQVESFFNSPEKNATISVVLLNPINDVLNLNITKTTTTTYQQLLNNVISRITIYLKHSFKTTITKNETVINLQSFNSAPAKIEFIKYIKQYSFEKYLASNSFSGKLTMP